jgi:hypothetical protein
MPNSDAQFDTTAKLDAVGNKKPSDLEGFLDGASRTRTGDLLGAIQALSQLSYSPGRRHVPRGCGTV